MRIGIQLPEVERVVPWPEYVAIARAAEEVGFDSIWVGDHLVYQDPPRGPWEATMAALAASAERVTIGPLVACLAFHPPSVLAKMRQHGRGLPCPAHPARHHRRRAQRVRAGVARRWLRAAERVRRSTHRGHNRTDRRPLVELREAGADEVLLVVSPINERSVRELGDVVSALNDRL